MVPVKEIDNYFVAKHPSSMPVFEEVFEAGETAIITLSLPGEEFESYGIYPATTKIPLKFLAKEDYTYEVSIYVTKGEDLIGGYVGNWTVNKNDLAANDEIKFNVITSDASTNEERFLFLSGLESYSKQIPEPTLR